MDSRPHPLHYHTPMFPNTHSNKKAAVHTIEDPEGLINYLYVFIFEVGLPIKSSYMNIYVYIFTHNT